MKENKISYEFFESEYQNHALELAKSVIDLNKYSCITAVGGDGTLHEVINGMLRRQDKIKIPLLLVPNGTGNDLCGSIKIDNIKTALNDLVKGKTMNIDVIKVLIDHEDEKDVPEEE